VKSIKLLLSAILIMPAVLSAQQDTSAVRAIGDSVQVRLVDVDLRSRPWAGTWIGPSCSLDCLAIA
jgi:hypothetical protein